MIKKIFAYVGSRNKHSKGLDLVNQITSYLDSKYSDELTVEIFTPQKINISPCEGCLQCFIKGKCPLEKLDESKLLKKSILNSNFIILESPVYFHNVSSDFKCLMDRLTYWTHLFRLAGKKCLLITSGSDNGTDKVMGILRLFSVTLGLEIVDEIIIDDKDNLIDNLDIQSLGNSIIKKIDSIGNHNTLLVGEAIFKNYQRQYKSSDKDYFESEYWKRNQMFEFNSLLEYIEHKSNTMKE